jgi:hypothetical protein
MNENVLNENAMEQFKRLIQSTENINKELDCYVQLVKEMLIKSYCNN